MCILKNFKNLLSSLARLEVCEATSVQTFDFSALYTSTPHELLKFSLNNIMNNALRHKNGAIPTSKLAEIKATSPIILWMVTTNILHNIHARFCGLLFKQLVGIPMGTNCAPLLVDSFSLFLRELVFRLTNKGWQKKVAAKFTFSYHYSDDCLS